MRAQRSLFLSTRVALQQRLLGREAHHFHGRRITVDEAIVLDYEDRVRRALEELFVYVASITHGQAGLQCIPVRSSFSTLQRLCVFNIRPS